VNTDSSFDTSSYTGCAGAEAMAAKEGLELAVEIGYDCAILEIDCRGLQTFYLRKGVPFFLLNYVPDWMMGLATANCTLCLINRKLYVAQKIRNEREILLSSVLAA